MGLAACQNSAEPVPVDPYLLPLADSAIKLTKDYWPRKLEISSPQEYIYTDMFDDDLQIYFKGPYRNWLKKWVFELKALSSVDSFKAFNATLYCGVSGRDYVKFSYKNKLGVIHFKSVSDTNSFNLYGTFYIYSER